MNAKDNVSNVVEKKSATFWFWFNTSVNLANAAIAKPIPAAFNAPPIFLTPPAVFSDAFSTSFKPSLVSLLPSATIVTGKQVEH